MKDLNEVDLAKLPSSIRAKIVQLDLELSEGDITEKGYWKKRNDLIIKYTDNKSNGRRRQKRFTRTENRYHSEVRQEAVQKALAEWSKELKDQPMPKPMRRRFSGKKNVVKPKTTSDSSSSDDDDDDDSTTIESSMDSKKEMGIQVKDNDLRPGDKTTENKPTEVRQEPPRSPSIEDPEPLIQIPSPEPPPRQESIQKSEAEQKPVAPPRCSSVLVEEARKENNSIYINTLQPGNDQKNGQEDYANTVIQPKAIKVSEKIQQLLLTLQVGGWGEVERFVRDLRC
ncbi:unnamed protein product [Bursaphelenchus xylophilus]|uniref:(pine wood nematode) hypothetical protein n=1 Tax=Bursaphelenchus xylophilus TaxID=6326 RepID=A0A1I7RL74_BURXY|nr:unnamed protein product [Bursaphelenchus xylophilus]CAG9083355.1 unnamed protein product [Bursaphelenchus xylophilus]